MIVSMLEDTREIKSILWNDEYGSMYEVGHGDCTKIEVYGEPGPYCDVPWIAVYVSDKLITRIPAQQVQVMYAQLAQTS